VRHTENNYVLCNKQTYIYIYIHTYIYIQTTTFIHIMCSYTDAFMNDYKRLVVALQIIGSFVKEIVADRCIIRRYNSAFDVV